MIKKFKNKINLHLILFGSSILLALYSLSVKIEYFPIYFFVDEAVQVLKAEFLINNNFRSSLGELLPLIMRRFTYWDLGLTVYLNIPGMLIFGKQIWVVRGTTVLISLLGSIFTSLILKNIFQVKNYWLGILFLISAPIFFLHSRTGFEIAIATSFYAGFLYYYLLYKTDKPRYLYFAIFYAALAFYSVNAVWIVISITLLLFMLFDLPYHLKNKKSAFIALIFACILFFPFFRWQIDNFPKTMRLLSKYKNPLAKKGSISDGVSFMTGNYLASLDLQYLFDPNYPHHPRHDLKGYGYFAWWSIPFIFSGLIYLLIKIKEPPFRTLLIAFIISPLGGAVAEPGSTRILPLAVTLALLFGLGVKCFEHFLNKFKDRLKLQLTFTLALFATLSFLIIFMVNDSLKNGPFWYNDYGLFGMQYGAKQLFQEAIPRYLKNNPHARLLVSPNWANGGDAFADFFLNKSEKKRVKIDSIDSFIKNYQPISSDLIFVMTPEDLLQTQKSNKFESPQIIKTIEYPDGRPGFFFVKVNYAHDITNIFAEELRIRGEPETEQLLINDQSIKITHSRFEEGFLANVFDGNENTFVRGWNGIPMIIQMEFPSKRKINSVTLNTGIINNFTITITVMPENQLNPTVITQSYTDNNTQSIFNFELTDMDIFSEKIKIDVRENNQGVGQIHLFEIKLR